MKKNNKMSVAAVAMAVALTATGCGAAESTAASVKELPAGNTITQEETDTKASRNAKVGHDTGKDTPAKQENQKPDAAKQEDKKEDKQETKQTKQDAAAKPGSAAASAANVLRSAAAALGLTADTTAAAPAAAQPAAEAAAPETQPAQSTNQNTSQSTQTPAQTPSQSTPSQNTPSQTPAQGGSDSKTEVSYTYTTRNHPATCTERGYVEHICNEDAAKTYRDSYTPALGHSWDNGTVTKAPTYAEAGVRTYTCTACGETRTEEIPQLEKTYHVKEVVPATCTEQGYTVYECDQVDGLTYKADYTDAQGHSWDEGTVTKAPTIYAAGEKTYTCTACGETKTETLPKLERTWSAARTVEPTCTEDGYTIYVCNESPDEIRYRDIVEALGHEWDEGTVTKAATCTEDGVRTYTCARCGETRTESIPAQGHSYDGGVVTKEPTYDEDGVRTYTCATCGDTYTESIPALHYTFTETVVAPTCKEQGYTLHTCNEDDSKSYKDSWTEPTAHSWDSGTVTKAPTCTEAGEMTYTCTACGETKTEAIPATGHTFYGGNCNTCGVFKDYNDAHFRQTIFEQTNAFRAENGLGALSYLDKYQAVADLRAKEQATLFGHTRPDGTKFYTALEELGYGDYRAAGLGGENAGWMQGDWWYDDWAVTGWKTSPPHRAAMLADGADGIIVGTYYDPITQKYYAVQLFFSSEAAEQFKHSPYYQAMEEPEEPVADETTEQSAAETPEAAAPAAEKAAPEEQEEQPAAEDTEAAPDEADTADTAADAAGDEETPEEAPEEADAPAPAAGEDETAPAQDEAGHLNPDDLYYPDEALTPAEDAQQTVELPAEALDEVYTVTADAGQDTPAPDENPAPDETTQNTADTQTADAGAPAAVQEAEEA